MNQKKVTIVTIAYNLLKYGREATFRQCVESVRGQTYCNVEHIIIDGASKDGSLDLIGEYVDKGWVKCYSEPDSGIYDAMNKGIEKAYGEYIAFLNSDDFYHNNKAIELSVKAMEKSGASISCAGVRFINENKKKIYKISFPKLHKIFAKIPFCHQTMFAKKAVLQKIGGFDTNFRICADYNVILKLFVDGEKFVVVDDVIVSYRDGGCASLDEKAYEKENFLALKNVVKIFLNVDDEIVWDMLRKKYVPSFILCKLTKKINITNRAKLYCLNTIGYVKYLIKKIVKV